MTITIATLRAAGLSAEKIVEVLEVAERERTEKRRTQNRVNQANSRSRRQQVSADIDDRADTADSADPSPQVSPPSMVSLNNPSLTTPSSSPSTDSSTVAGATRRDAFEEFWESYPKREGANPRKPARQVFLAKLKAGSTAEEIVAGARACAIRDRANIGTPYIPQAVKWLRDERWRDYGTLSGQSGGADAAHGWTPGKRTSAEILADLERESRNGQGSQEDRLEQAAPVDEDGQRLRGGESGLFRNQH